MKNKLLSILGLLIAFLGYILQNDWGFLMITIGGYLFFSSLMKNDKK